MLTQLRGGAAPTDAVGLMLECHERIRGFLALARRIAGASMVDPAELADATLRVRRYFTEALPLHARDEEESILPRLRGLDPRVDAELAAMAREHGEHGRPLAALVAACDAIASRPARLAAVAPALEKATAELERHFAEHLAREETVIFPAVRRLLDASADAAIMREIRARRGG